VGHKPDQKARKRRRDREAARTFADELRANARLVPQAQREEEKLRRATFIEEAYGTCRKAALERSRAGSVRKVEVTIAPSPSMTNAEYHAIARRLRKDDLKVSFYRKRVKANMETTDAGAVFNLSW
jgi:divalent metal cation (Fe/Co/Zn/Cd) transporter